MKIIGFNFKKISIERKKDIKGKLEIKTNIDIKGIEKDKIEIAGEVVKFDYSYKISYAPDFAEIEFNGTVLVIPDSAEDIKNIVKDWKKKKVREDLRIFIFNFIMGKCNLKALQMEEDFALPPHIPLPRLSKQVQQGKANYTG